MVDIGRIYHLLDMYLKKIADADVRTNIWDTQKFRIDVIDK